MPDKTITNFYISFEDKFRGSRDLVNCRLQIYLPFIKPLQDIYPGASAIDLGCGRGEWLEILNTHGFSSQGVDLNDSMLASCRERELNVQTAEAITFLKQLPHESQAIVSAFHLVEHISFNDLQKLVYESLRVLKPAGLLILETPNPENIKVATENFYLDPTHIKPIPANLLAFLPEFYGFKRTKIVRLQENKDLVNSHNISLLNVIEGTSPDYAVITQKNAEPKLLTQFESIFAKDIGLTLTALTAKFETRLQEIEKMARQAETKASQAKTKASQAETKASQAEVRASQAKTIAEQAEADTQRAEAKSVHLHAELHSAYTSHSWKVTAPLRWASRQVKLLLQQGLIGRTKALLKKATTAVFQKSNAYIHARPALRNRVVNILKKLRMYTPLRTTYLRLTGRHHETKNLCVEQLTSSAKQIYERLDTTINDNVRSNS